MARILATTLAVVVLAIGFCAAAQTNDDEALTQFQQGVELYKDGEFEQAAIAFERAYDLKPSFKILYNMGQAQNELRHYAEALRSYVRYMNEGKTQIEEGRRAEVEKEIKRLKALVGRVKVKAAQDGLTVFIDGRRQSDTPMKSPVYVDLGEHEVQLKDGADEVHREVIKVAGGQTVSVEVGEGSQEALAAEDSAAEEDDESPKRVWTWVALGVGVAVGIGAGVTGGISSSRVGDIKGDCEGNSCPANLEKDADSAKTLGNVSTALTIVAAVGVVAGITLFFVEPKLGEKEEPSVALIPTPTPDGAALVLTGRF